LSPPKPLDHPRLQEMAGPPSPSPSPLLSPPIVLSSETSVCPPLNQGRQRGLLPLFSSTSQPKVTHLSSEFDHHSFSKNQITTGLISGRGWCVLGGCVVGNVVSQRRGPRGRTLQEEGELGQPTLTPAPSSHAHTLNSTPLSLSPSLPISLSILFVHRDEIWHMRFHQSARAGELAGRSKNPPPAKLCTPAVVGTCGMDMRDSPRPARFYGAQWCNTSVLRAGPRVMGLWPKAGLD
jgi:hypothetical protein